MEAVAVGGFHDQIMGSGNGLWVLDNRLVVSAQVPREEEDSSGSEEDSNSKSS